VFFAFALLAARSQCIGLAPTPSFFCNETTWQLDGDLVVNDNENITMEGDVLVNGNVQLALTPSGCPNAILVLRSASNAHLAALVVTGTIQDGIRMILQATSSSILNVILSGDTLSAPSATYLFSTSLSTNWGFSTICEHPIEFEILGTGICRASISGARSAAGFGNPLRIHWKILFSSSNVGCVNAVTPSTTPSRSTLPSASSGQVQSPSASQGQLQSQSRSTTASLSPTPQVSALGGSSSQTPSKKSIAHWLQASTFLVFISMLLLIVH